MLVRFWQNRHNRKTINNRGFLMADILVGIFILSIALVALSMAYRQSTVTTISTRNSYQGIYWAHQALEQLKVYDEESQTTLSASVWTTDVSINADTTRGLPAYRVQTHRMTGAETPAEIASLSSGMQALIVPVLATVTWTEPTGATPVSRSLSIISYYYLKN